MFSGMAMVFVWILVSVGVMKTGFNTTLITPQNSSGNFMWNVLRIAEPEDDGVFLYSLPPGDSFPGRAAYSHIQEGLPHQLDLSRGLYEVKISGSAPPLGRGDAEVFYIRQRIRLGRFPVLADEYGRFATKKFLYMPRGRSEAVNIFVEGEDAFEVEETVITPVPLWLESLSGHIAGSGEHYGLFRHRQRDFPVPFEAVPSFNFSLDSPILPGLLPNMLDGNPATRWTSDAAQSPGMYFEVDMGETYEVAGIRLIQGDFWKDWPRGLKVYASTDGESWEKVYDDALDMAGYVYDDGEDYFFRNMESCVRAVFGPVEARRLRIEQTRREEVYWWSAAGFEVLSEKNPGNME